MADTKRYYVTTPIYYVNDVPHIGHAYTTLACDVLARFMRLDGLQVHFQTGTDEHGQKVEKSAKAAGMEPQAFTDMVSAGFRDLVKVMNFSIDDFIRTTEGRHRNSCQELWRRLQSGGHIYLGSYAGWYAVRDEAYYAEDELTGAPGGRRLAPSGAEVEWVEEPSYFFKLSEWQQKLLDFYDRNPDFIAPESRRNEVISFVRSGLRDLSVSRTSFQWGVRVPDDPKHIMYVWLDALINYITAVGFPEDQSEMYRRFWPADLHMVGKDILRFHAIYWPAFLMAAGLEPPRRVFAHGWWTNEGQKISKSLGNVIDPVQLVQKYGLEQVRYYLMREIPFGQDGDYSHRSMVHRMNGDLANDLGNLAQRVLAMINKNCGAAMPESGSRSDADKALLNSSGALLVKCRALMAEQSFHKVIESIWHVVGEANRYVDEQAPWALRKTDIKRMATVLGVLAETVRRIAILTQPFMPTASNRILDQLGVSSDGRNFAALGPGHEVKAGTSLPKPEGVFPRYQEESA